MGFCNSIICPNRSEISPEVSDKFNRDGKFHYLIIEKLNSVREIPVLAHEIHLHQPRDEFDRGRQSLCGSTHVRKHGRTWHTDAAQEVAGLGQHLDELPALFA